jgi:hypothetical protein
MVGTGLRTSTRRPLLDEKFEPSGYPIAGLCRQLEDRDPRPHPLQILKSALPVEFAGT